MQARKKALAEVNSNILKLESRFMKEEISTETHKRWYENYMAERGVIEAESQNVNKVNVERREKVVRVLPTWVDLKSLYRKASDGQKTTC